jgi:hypothetical protein
MPKVLKELGGCSCAGRVAANSAFTGEACSFRRLAGGLCKKMSEKPNVSIEWLRMSIYIYIYT